MTAQGRYESDAAEFRRSLSVLLGPAIVEGNAVDSLLNGDQIFPAMLKAIREARRTITFETYIYWSGSIGDEFVAALTERAGAGVKVHVLLDGVGSLKMDPALIDVMRKAGIEVERFHEPHGSNWGKLNITHAQWKARPWTEKMLERLASTLQSQLGSCRRPV